MNLNRNSQLGITLVTIIVGLISYFYIDLPLAQWCHQHLPETGLLHKIGHYTTDLGSWATHTIVLVSLLLATYLPSQSTFLPKQLLNPKNRKTYLKIALIYVVTLIITTTSKIIISRYRPYAYFEQGLFGFNPTYSLQLYSLSFPSAHAAIVAIANLVIIQLSSQKKSFFIGLVTIISLWVGITRIILSLHYLSDIIAGFYIGFFVAFWLSKKLNINPSSIPLKDKPQQGANTP